MGSTTLPRSPAFPPVLTRDKLREIERPEYPSACGGGRTAGDAPLQRRRGFRPAVGLVPPVLQLLFASRPLTRAVATASADPWGGLCQTVAALYSGHGGATDGPCLDVARSVVVACAALAAAGGRVRTQEWWEAARGGGLHRRCAPTRPAVRASPGVKGPLGYYASPLV